MAQSVSSVRYNGTDKAVDSTLVRIISLLRISTHGLPPHPRVVVLSEHAHVVLLCIAMLIFVLLTFLDCACLAFGHLSGQYRGRLIVQYGQALLRLYSMTTWSKKFRSIFSE